jgi:hypothetical protein
MSARPGLCGGHQATGGVPTAISLRGFERYVSNHFRFARNQGTVAKVP